MPEHRRDRRHAALTLVALLLGAAVMPGAGDCAAASALSVGMSKAQVRMRMGAPERIGVLRGKDIERVAPEAESRASGRLVYFYRDGRVAVWFDKAKVTGVTCNASTGARPTDQAEDH